MQTTTTPNYLPALARPQFRDEVGRELEAVLHDLIALTLTGKQLGWTVNGRSADALHLQLNALTERWNGLADDVAERAATLGYSLDGQAAAVAAGSSLTSVPAGEMDDATVIHQIAHRIAEVSERTRDRLDRVGAMDLISQSVLSDVVRALESDQRSVRVQASQPA